jgi:hypothetical protein
MGVTGRGVMPPMPCEDGLAGRTGVAIGGATGFGVTGAAVAGLDAVVFTAGFAAVRLRADVLRAGFRAGFLAVLRAEVLRAVALRAVARLAPVLRAVRAVLRPALRVVPAAFRAVLRVARAVFRAVLRVARAVFRAALRGLVFLLVVRFFPLVLVAMVLLRFCSDAALDRLNGRVPAQIMLHWSRLAVSQAESIPFSLYDDRWRKWQFGALPPQKSYGQIAPLAHHPSDDGAIRLGAHG